MGKDWFNFATCLSPESGLLDQWQAFADQGKGCAIELAFPTIVEACNGGKEYDWTQMLYDSAEQRDRAERMVDVAIEVFRTEDVITEGEAIVYWTEAAFSFLCGGTRFKTSEFKNQREWRILRSRGSESREINEFDSRRYIPWRLPKSAVTGVVLGPNCESADAEIAGLLSAAGYEASVRRASITWGVD
jgi:hypothetical protein